MYFIYNYYFQIKNKSSSIVNFIDMMQSILYRTVYEEVPIIECNNNITLGTKTKNIALEKINTSNSFHLALNSSRSLKKPY